MAEEYDRVADVICQHTRDGTIIPIKIRIKDEDGEYQTFVIKGYKDLTNYGKFNMPNGISVANHMWLFECKIQVLNMEKRIRLFYNAFDNRWKVDRIR